MGYVSVAEARYLAQKHGIDRMVIIQVMDNGQCAFTSYGKDRKTCDAVRRWVDDVGRTDAIAAEIHAAR